MQRLAHLLAYFALRLAICVVQALPLGVCEVGARLLATLLWNVLRVRRKVIEENLRHAYPELTEQQRARLAWQMWQHLALFVVEIAHTARKLHGTNYHELMRIRGEAEMVKALLDERPLITVTAHFGVFELASYALTFFGYEVYSVARPLDNPYLDRWMNSFRGSRGQTILSKQEDYQRMLDLLAAGANVMFVADQYAGHKGCWVDFFGRPASAHKAIALFALDYDAHLGVGYCRRVGRPMQFELALKSVIDSRSAGDEIGGMRELTQWYTREFEEMIRDAPEQYWWLHRRWKGDPPARLRRKTKAA